MSPHAEDLDARTTRVAETMVDPSETRRATADPDQSAVDRRRVAAARRALRVYAPYGPDGPPREARRDSSWIAKVR